MKNIPDTKNERPLQPLVGRQLSAVVFVQDYVQLQFDGPGLTALTWPVVRVGAETHRFGTTGYRDALCECITKVVQRASLVEGQDICIVFDDGAEISISLKPEDYTTAEAVIFNNGPHETWVW